MLNHEWQKHGTCLSAPEQLKAAGYRQNKASTPNADEDAVYAYFDLALWIDGKMEDQLQAFNGWTGVVDLTAITSLFDLQVQVLCDPFNQPNNATHARFLELRSCWQME